MFGKKKETTRPRSNRNLAQYGLFDIPGNLDDIGAHQDDDNDEDLEAELAALTTGDDTDYKRKRTARKPIPDAALNAMVAESMKDIDVDDENDSGGEDDPELLSELKMITRDESVQEEEEPSSESKDVESTKEEDAGPNEELIKTLEERLQMYEKAEEKAKRDNETGRARRFNRGIKTLKEFLSNAHAGKRIEEGDIPPVLPSSAITDVEKEPEKEASPTEPNIPSEENPSPETTAPAVVDQEVLEKLKTRQQEYKIAAVVWKKAGNMQKAIEYVKISKQFDIVIGATSAGEVIDLSDMPPSPELPSSDSTANNAPVASKEESESQKQADTETVSSVQESPSYYGLDNLELALKERLEVYRRIKTTAETEGNSSKARRYGRICKQFEDAVKLHARGKTVPLDELPVPPGFPPLASPQPAAPVPEVQPVPQEAETSATPEENPDVKPVKKSPPVPPPRSTAGKKQNLKITSRAEKQLMQLQQRQLEFKQAALSAKKEGDLELARDYLRQAKGLDPLIEASKGGLPVDMNSIPLSPVAKMELSAHGITGGQSEDFTLVYSEECTEETVGGTDEQIYENLEAQLVKQIKWCLSTRDHSKALGDVPGYNRWERLALGYTRDLDMLRVRKRDALPSPQHHYETKTYAIVQSCTDLNDSDIEISIIRGINFPREADTYVMFEFPHPSDNSPSDRTSTIKASNNPEYEAVFPLSGIIDRNSRQCQRAFKRHALKCQVWSKGGFFRSDSLLGTVTVKLQPLESQCILHDTFPLMDGRKPTGGKLEVKIRLRNPIVTKQIEQITDRWLIIDH